MEKTKIILDDEQVMFSAFKKRIGIHGIDLIPPDDMKKKDQQDEQDPETTD